MKIKRNPREQLKILPCYEDHKRLLFKFAWKTYYLTGIEIEDLISEMNVVFCEAFNTYDVALNDTFSNYLGKCCQNRIKNIIRDVNRKKRKLILYTDNPLDRLSYNPEDSIILFDNFVNNPNKIIREIAKIISTYNLPKSNFRVWLKKELRKLNFKFEDIWEGFQLIETIYEKE